MKIFGLVICLVVLNVPLCAGDLDQILKNPDEELILGFGFNRVAYGRWPTKADLDAEITDRPVFILDNTIHDVWMNSKAFEPGQVPDDDADQVPGVMFWQRDAAGDRWGFSSKR